MDKKSNDSMENADFEIDQTRKNKEQAEPCQVEELLRSGPDETHEEGRHQFGLVVKLAVIQNVSAHAANTVRPALCNFRQKTENGTNLLLTGKVDVL